MKKVTILAVIVIAGAIASVVACGDSAKPADNPGSTTTTTSSGAATDSAAPAGSAAPSK